MTSSRELLFPSRQTFIVRIRPMFSLLCSAVPCPALSQGECYFTGSTGSTLPCLRTYFCICICICILLSRSRKLPGGYFRTTVLRRHQRSKLSAKPFLRHQLRFGWGLLQVHRRHHLGRKTMIRGQASPINHGFHRANHRTLRIKRGVGLLCIGITSLWWAVVDVFAVL